MKFTDRKRIRIAFVLLTLILVVSPIHASAAKIKLNKTSITLMRGSAKRLKVKGTRKTVKWSSSKRSVAAVSKTGLVTAKKKGRAVITAKVGKKKYTCRVTVKQPVTKIKLKKDTVYLKPKQSYTMKATVSPKGANDKRISWSSSNKKIARVNSKGKITAVKKGTAVITAKARDGSGIFARCTVVVTASGQPPMTLDKSSVTLTTLKSMKLTAKNAKGTVKWQSSNPGVVTVASDGTIYAAKVGSAVITAVSAGESAVCVVNSEAPKASAAAYTFLGIVNRYSLELQEYLARGCLVGYSCSTKLAKSDWASARRQLDTRGIAYTNCAMLVRWGLTEMGYLEYGQNFWGIDANKGDSHSWCYKGLHFASKAVRDKVLEHCEIIEVNDTPDHLAVTGQLLPGDICTWYGMHHTNVFIGNGTFFDAGRGPSDGRYWKKSDILKKFSISKTILDEDIKNDENNPVLSDQIYIFNSFGPEEQWDRYYAGRIANIIRIVR